MATLSTQQLSNAKRRPASDLVIAATAAVALLSMCVPDAQADFDYPDFSDTTGLVMNGSASTLGSSILVVTPANTSQIGSVWYNQKQAVGSAFTSSFEFVISNIHGQGSDGFAFVIQNQSVNALGGSGGALGYATNLMNPSVPGISNSIAIEFDLWNNQNNWPDFNSNAHISVQTDGLNPNKPSEAFSLGAFLLPVDFAEGSLHQVQINYAANTLEIFLDDFSSPILSVGVNLATLLNLDSGNLAYVGLTAATGANTNSQQHEIRSWNFAGTVPAPGVGGSLIAGGVLAGVRRRRRHS